MHLWWQHQFEEGRKSAHNTYFPCYSEENIFISIKLATQFSAEIFLSLLIDDVDALLLHDGWWLSVMAHLIRMSRRRQWRSRHHLVIPSLSLYPSQSAVNSSTDPLRQDDMIRWALENLSLFGENIITVERVCWGWNDLLAQEREGKWSFLIFN